MSRKRRYIHADSSQLPASRYACAMLNRRLGLGASTYASLNAATAAVHAAGPPRGSSFGGWLGSPWRGRQNGTSVPGRASPRCGKARPLPEATGASTGRGRPPEVWRRGGRGPAAGFLPSRRPAMTPPKLQRYLRHGMLPQLDRHADAGKAAADDDAIKLAGMCHAHTASLLAVSRVCHSEQSEESGSTLGTLDPSLCSG